MPNCLRTQQPNQRSRGVAVADVRTLTQLFDIALGPQQASQLAPSAVIVAVRTSAQLLDVALQAQQGGLR
jgi:hypothetical protein